MKQFSVMIIALALALAGSQTLAREISGSIAVDESFAEIDFKWNTSGGFFLRLKPIEVDGMLEICAVLSHSSQARHNLNLEAMREARFIIDDKTMLRNLSFVGVVSSAHKKNKLIGQQANCVAAGKAFPQKASQYGIKFRRGNYRADR